MIGKPSISVVCPTFNSAEFILQTVRSILGQTVPPSEIIFSDDGSLDNTSTLIEELTADSVIPVSILHNPHRGPGAARNAGIRAATGEWIAFLDSDDLWQSNKIERVSLAIKEYSTMNFFCHDQYHRFLNGQEEPLRLAKRYQDCTLKKQLFRACPFATSAVVCKKELFFKHGLFDERLLSAQDFELWLRLCPFLQVKFIDEVLGWYVDRSGNISSSRRFRHFCNVMQALKKNKKNTKPIWYFIGRLHHTAVYLKNQLWHCLKKFL